MKVVVDFRKYDGVVGGVEQVVMQILERLCRGEQQFVVLSKVNRIEEVKELVKELPNIKHIALPVLSHAISLKNAYHDSVTIQNIAEDEKAQVIHFPYNWSFPYRKKVPTILTIHDVIPFAFREAMGFFRNHFLYKPAIKKACKLNTMISTISEFSKQDIVEKVGAPAEKIRVIPNGFRTPYAPNAEMEKKLVEKFHLQEGFLLNVGGIHERKNIARMIQAFAKFVQQSNYKGKLLITGKVSGAPYQEKMRVVCERAVTETGMKEQVVFTGFVSDEELDQLLRRAECLVYPSLYEGFGIPILEAMNASVPVITSNGTATREVGEGASLLVDPYNVEEMASAMVRLHWDKKLRDELIAKGRERVKLYSWDKLARQYLSLYEEAAGQQIPG